MEELEENGEGGGEREEKGYLMCFMCCKYFKRLSEEGEEDLGSQKDFKKFCGELQQSEQDFLGGSWESGYQGENKFIAPSLLALLSFGKCKNRFFGCWGCLEGIKEVVEVKEEMMEVEEGVRKLQGEIVKQLGVLEGKVEGYFKGMKKIERILRDSDEKGLEEEIEKEAARGTKSWMKRDFKSFREKVMEVSENFQRFKGNLDKITLKRSKVSPVPSKNKENDPRKSVKTKNLIELNSRTVEVEPEYIKIEPMDFDIQRKTGSFEDEDYHTFEYDNYEPDYHSDEASSGASGADDNFEGNDKGSDISESEDDSIDFKDDDRDEEYLPETPGPSKKGKLSSSRAIQSQNRKLPESLSFKGKHKKVTLDYTGVNLKSMGPFKKAAVLRALRRKALLDRGLFPFQKKAQAIGHDNLPIEKLYEPFKIFQLFYHGGSTDKLLVGNSVEVVINEKQKTVECSICHFIPDSIDKQHVMDKCIQQHIVCKHMNNLPCPVDGCGMKFLNKKYFKTHLHTTHQNNSKRKNSIQNSNSKGEEGINPDLTDVNIYSFSPFKRGLVNRALARSANKKKAQQSLECCSDVTKKYDSRLLYYLNYDAASDKLFIGSCVEISIDEDKETIHCSLCPHFVKANCNDNCRPDSQITVHVLQIHMDQFPCPVPGCGERIKNQWGYRNHLRIHQGFDILQCDICGKPATSKDNMAYHKWTHKNEEEVEEAVKRGEIDPRRRMRDRKTENLFRCKICKKGFTAVEYLRRHEETHQDDRMKIVCPKCGKKMLKRSYDHYHRKFACPMMEAGKPRNVNCPHKGCDNNGNKGYVRMVVLRRHLRDVHGYGEEGGDKQWICEVCGKSYENKGRLTAHLIIHKDRVLKCRFGCGMSFYSRTKWKLHDNKCKGGKQKIRKWKNGYGSWDKEHLKANLDDIPDDERDDVDLN